MRQLSAFERKLVEDIKHNSLLFLERGVRMLMEKNKASQKDRVVLSCTDIQIALELAMREFLIREEGLNHVLDQKQRDKYSEEELIELYEGNNLKVTDFDALKKSLRGMREAPFDREDFKVIERFQNYRNKIIHFSCALKGESLDELEERLIYYVVQIVLRLLYDNYEDKGPAEYFEELLGYNFYQILWGNGGYREAIEKLAAERSTEVGNCPICGSDAYDMANEFCFFCNIHPEDEWGRTDCLACNGKKTVIYDLLNIHVKGNGHSMPGYCQKCGAKTFKTAWKV